MVEVAGSGVAGYGERERRHRGWTLARGPTRAWEATDPSGRVWTGRPPPGHPDTDTATAA